MQMNTDLYSSEYAGPSYVCPGCGYVIGRATHACPGPRMLSNYPQQSFPLNTSGQRVFVDGPPSVVSAFIGAGGSIAKVTVCSLLLLIALCGTASAQPYAYAPPQQPPAYAYYYQPVAVPGDYYYMPRRLSVLDAVLGPRYIFVPRPQAQPPQVPPLQMQAPQR